MNSIFLGAMAFTFLVPIGRNSKKLISMVGMATTTSCNMYQVSRLKSGLALDISLRIFIK